jgi:hypothetical protein
MMKKKLKTWSTVLLVSVCFIFSGIPLWAAAEKEQRVGAGVVLHPVRVEQAPKIDGVLDDPAWQNPPAVKAHYISNRPVYGEVSPQKTEVWMAYNSDNLYFAIYAHDDEPAKIKATVSRRDNFWGDDWVGVDLDATGERKVVYEFICNPRGIQADALNSSSSGESLEPDWVWYSAGRIVKDGYIVEMRIPLKSISFKSGENITMHTALYRFISRTGENSSWPQISEKQGYFNSLAPTKYDKLDKQLRLEALPSVTYGSIWDRESPDKWSAADDKADLGIGVKYGVTSSVTAELTVNPDFSQVESDQFQVLANQRYPIFYSEKRPFFMEVGNQFNLSATGGDTNMRAAVHTRRIVDPAWGGKLTGDVGKVSFGLLAAGDEWPGRQWEGEVNPYAGKNANYMFGRFKYGLKGDSYVGLIYSGREFGGRYNRVLGGDVRWRFKGYHNLAIQGLYSETKNPDQGPGVLKGGAFSAFYLYFQKKLGMELILEHLGKDFRMDSAFYQRGAMTKLTAYIGPNFYPKSKKRSWLRKINPFIFTNFIHDLETGMDDFFILGAIRIDLTKQGTFRVDYRHYEESWAGRKFTYNTFAVQGGVQLNKWFNIYTHISGGRGLLYDPVNPFLGKTFTFGVDTRLQPTKNLTQELNYTRRRFDRLTGNERVFDVDILVSRTIYQFNRYLFFRGLIQYDSYSRLVLTDLLASFTLIPGTVVHVGYGSLHQDRYWNRADNRFEYRPGMGKYYQTTQSLFLKVSYLFRF